MHKFLFFLFFFVNGITGKSQTSRLVFYSENGETFQIEMDGKLYNQIPSYYIKLENTSPGKHVFTLSFSEKGTAPIKKVFSPKPGWEYTYVIQKKTGQNIGGSVQFRGKNYQVTQLFVWAENAGYAVRQISGINLNSGGADAFTPASSNENVVNGGSSGGQNNSGNYSGGSGATFNYGAAQGYTSPGGYSGPTGTVIPCAGAGNAAEFEKAISAVRNNSGNPDQKPGAKDYLTLNCVNSAQARNLVSEFANEIDRLEIARFAWHRTFDRSNFFVVFDAFSEQASIEALKVYMQENP